jgi:GntR family transcriptional repressor for pyruvate dehydrogenase complex
MTAAADGPMLRVQRVRSSHRQVAEQLRELIVAGELSPSDRLPSELRMAELFGVSRSTVREALRSLVADGIVETRRGVRGGTFVVDRNIQDLEAALVKALQTLAARAAGGSGDLLEMWEAIEAVAAGRAATVADASQIALLNDLSLPTEEESLDSEIVDRLAEFHYAVLRASSSPLLEAIGRPLATVATIRLVRPATPREFWDGISADHRAIAKAIADRDAQRASRLTGLHILRLRDETASRTALPPESSSDRDQPTVDSTTAR